MFQLWVDLGSGDPVNDAMMSEDFAKNLKRLLEQRGLSVKEAAKRVGTSEKNLREWLSGRSPRDLDAVRRLASVLGIGIHDLLFSSPDPIGMMADIFERTEVHTGLYRVTVEKVSPKKGGGT